MMRLEFLLGSLLVVVVVGCASTRKEQVNSRPVPARSATPAVAFALGQEKSRARLDVDPSLRADAMGHVLARQARELGVEPPIAFVWGDVSSLPGARPIELNSDHRSIQGFLVGSAQNLDMGKLAPDIHDVVLIACEKTGLVASQPSTPEKTPFDLDARTDHESFAFVSIEPGDVSDEARAGDVLALLDRLPSRVRYAVMGLPE